MSGLLTATVLCAAAVSACGGSGSRPSSASSSSSSSPTPAATAVSVFPVAGSRVATPGTQIAFRGTSAHGLGKVTVTGSSTGIHAGRLEADSDGRGASFLPDHPFTPGETVTVKAGVPLIGGPQRTVHFTVAEPAPLPPSMPVTPIPRVAGDLQQFRSRPDLQPPAVTVVKNSSSAQPGDVFVANQNGPERDGAMILDASGALVWFHPVASGNEVTDFHVQSYQGKPSLTWWQGTLRIPGLGTGEDVIFDRSYRQVAVVKAGNGLAADLHEFRLTPQGTALVTAYNPVYWDESSVNGPHRAIVLDCAVQEIDIKTGLVLFQWDSLDHVPLSDSQVPLPTTANTAFDYFHVNSIQRDDDNDLVVSARNTWATYKVSHTSGQVIWTLGGKSSTFKLGDGATFAFQHDVRLSNGDQKVTLFDDGAGPPNVHTQSRGLALKLDSSKHTASVSAQFTHSPPVLAQFEGNVQSLANGDVFVGWGGQPNFTEYDSSSNVVWDGRFVDANASYRAYRDVWTGTPRTSPEISVSRTGSGAAVYASWNGATGVRAWRVLAGASAGSVKTVSTTAKTGFETQVNIAYQPYVVVQALAGDNRVLATSAPAHLS